MHCHFQLPPLSNLRSKWLHLSGSRKIQNQIYITQYSFLHSLSLQSEQSKNNPAKVHIFTRPKIDRFKTQDTFIHSSIGWIQISINPFQTKVSPCQSSNSCLTLFILQESAYICQMNCKETFLGIKSLQPSPSLKKAYQSHTIQLEGTRGRDNQ